MKDLFSTESLFGHGTSLGHKFKITNLFFGSILRRQVSFRCKFLGACNRAFEGVYGEVELWEDVDFLFYKLI